ncbi:MAG: hypothetical protein ACTSVI_08845 [Promethearchaeota archaeon]
MNGDEIPFERVKNIMDSIKNITKYEIENPGLFNIKAIQRFKESTFRFLQGEREKKKSNKSIKNLYQDYKNR